MAVNKGGRQLPNAPDPSWRVHTRDGLVLAGDAWGPGDGQTICLLHGGGQTRHSWKAAGQTLGQYGYRTLAYDARGHGDSSWSPDGEYSESALVADLSDVVAELSVDRPCVLVGASMGGIAALAAVGQNIVPARALVLVDVVPQFNSQGVGRIKAFMDAGRDGFASLEDMADSVARYQPQRARPATMAGLAKNARIDSDGRYRWHWDPAFNPDFDGEEMRAQYDAYARMVTIPTLLVRGGLSDVVQKDGAQDFLKVMPHAELAEVDDAAHMVAGDDNAVFLERIIAFLARVLSSP